MKYLNNRNVILILALFLGLFFGSCADKIRFFTIPDLTIMMTISLVGFSFKSLSPIKRIIGPSLKALFLSYILFGACFYLLLLLFPDMSRETRLGYFLVMAAPPGVVVVPFTSLLKGNLNFAVVGTMISYLFLFIIFPLTVYFSMGEDVAIDYFGIVYLLFMMIVFPFILSRILRLPQLLSRVERIRPHVVNWTFFLLIYIVIGLNRSLFIEQPQILIYPFLIFGLMHFFVGGLFEIVLKHMGVSKSDRISYTLMFVVKNNGFSAVAALQLVGKGAALPSAALSVVLLLFLICFSWRHGEK